MEIHSWPERATEEMDLMLLVYFNWPSLSLCSHYCCSPEYLPLNCQTWLGGVYYWKNQPSRVTARPSSKCAQLRTLPAAASPIVNAGYFSFSWGSNRPGLSTQCHFLWLWTLSKTQFQSQGRREREREKMCRLRHLTNGTSTGWFLSFFVFLMHCVLEPRGDWAKPLQQFQKETQNLPVPPRPDVSKWRLLLNWKEAKKKLQPSKVWPSVLGDSANHFTQVLWWFLN